MRGGGPGVQGAGWEEAPSRACGTAEWVPGWLPPVPPLALAPIRSMAGGTHCGSVGHSSPLRIGTPCSPYSSPTSCLCQEQTLFPDESQSADGGVRVSFPGPPGKLEAVLTLEKGAPV